MLQRLTFSGCSSGLGSIPYAADSNWSSSDQPEGGAGVCLRWACTESSAPQPLPFSAAAQGAEREKPPGAHTRIGIEFLSHEPASTTNPCGRKAMTVGINAFPKGDLSLIMPESLINALIDRNIVGDTFCSVPAPRSAMLVPYWSKFVGACTFSGINLEQRWHHGMRRWPPGMQLWQGGSQRWLSNVAGQANVSSPQHETSSESAFVYKGPLSQAVKNLKVRPFFTSLFW